MTRATERVVAWAFLGSIPYKAAWDMQEALRAHLIEGSGQDTLLLVEHPGTISIGRGETGGNILVGREDLRTRGFDVVETNRGGKVTYHGPGQLVAYPVLNLRHFRLGVKAYVRALEEVMIRTLAGLGVRAERRDAWPGAWVGGRKIGSIGIHVRKQVTIHGLALNLCPRLEDFLMITPCGIAGVSMTSAEREGAFSTPIDILPRFLEIFAEVFSCTLVESPQLPCTAL